MKKLYTSAPILAYLDYKLPFVLHTDSSSEGLGAVLYQKQDGKLRVIAYASRSVSMSESHYPAHKLEFLALKWAVCEKFHEYLYGSNTFEVYTDNNPLTYVFVRHNLAMHHSVTSFVIWQPIWRPHLLERVYKPMHTSH